MQLKKIAYWITTALMSGIFLFSAYMYLTKLEMVEGFYQHLGFPTWIILPLAILKILGVIVVWIKKPRILMEWAYAGFFFDAVLAFFAHGMKDDQWMTLALGAIILVILSRTTLALTETK